MTDRAEFQRLIQHIQADLECPRKRSCRVHRPHAPSALRHMASILIAEDRAVDRLFLATLLGVSRARHSRGV